MERLVTVLMSVVWGAAALQDFNAPIDAYFMLNSAVPSEAYDADAPTHDFATNAVPAGLVHDDWRAYPAKSWAAMWHRHFLPHGDYLPTEADTARAQLTWKGRFRDVPQNRGATVYNYYSGEDGATGDEVLELMETTPEPTSGFEWFKAKGRYSWQKQACFKGREHDTKTFLEGLLELDVIESVEGILEKMVASDEMGWGFEGGIDNRSAPEKVQTFTDIDFRERPIFLRNPSLILENNASAILVHRDHLLAYAIPELSKPTGKTPLHPRRSFNLQSFISPFSDETKTQSLWARPLGNLRDRWLHSDIKDVAFPFTRNFYRMIIQQGALKWEENHSSE